MSLTAVREDDISATEAFGERAWQSIATNASPQSSPQAMVRVLTCGSVDDGKSTLIGRLLWDAADLPEDTRATIAASAGADGIPDVSLLLDGLEAERSQGITIDLAWRYFDLVQRRYVIIDCPGHEQYTRNMATGASQADLAIMLVDARQGLKTQTRRHAAILELVGIRHVLLAVNKMDLVDWSEAQFRAIASDFAALAARSGFETATAIPVASRLGENVARRSDRMAWHRGPTLLEALEQSRGRLSAKAAPFRFPVQSVIRGAKDFRGLAGTIAAGSVQPGDEVVEVLSGKRARVSRISTFDGDRASASAGAAVALVLDRDLDISRGGLLCSTARRAHAARSIEARVVWLSELAPTASGLLFRTGSDLVPVSTFAVTARTDLDTLQRVRATTCGANDLVDVRIGFARPVGVDLFNANTATGHFVLVDALSGATVAGGTITAADSQTNDKQPENAFRLTRSLLASTVCSDLGETESARLEFKRRAAEVAFILSAAGVRVDLEANQGDAEAEDCLP